MIENNQIYKARSYISFKFLIPILIVAASCEKEITLSEKGKMLTDGVWKIVNAGIDSNMNNQLSLNEIDTMPACQRDNSWEFQPSGNLLINDLGVSCGPSLFAGQSWNLADNDTFLEIKFYNGAISSTAKYKILELSQIKMLLADRENPQTIFEYGR